MPNQEMHVVLQTIATSMMIVVCLTFIIFFDAVTQPHHIAKTPR